VFILVSSKQPLRVHKGRCDGRADKVISGKARGNCFDTYFVFVVIMSTIEMFL